MWIFDILQKIRLADLLYYADNLAYCPFQVVDEPLFIIHHIDIVISVTGSNLLQAFKEVSLSSSNIERSVTCMLILLIILGSDPSPSRTTTAATSGSSTKPRNGIVGCHGRGKLCWDPVTTESS